jgi:hypothetical protein
LRFPDMGQIAGQGMKHRRQPGKKIVERVHGETSRIG